MLQIITQTFMTIPSVTGMLGVSVYSATRVVDAIFVGFGVFKILSLIATSGASISVALLLMKKISKKVGKKAAITW